MKILISGSRYWPLVPVAKVRKTISNVLDEFRPEDALLVGDAPGIDQWAIEEAARRGIRTLSLGAYSKHRYQENHPTLKKEFTTLDYVNRDRVLVNIADKVIAIWNGSSGGTKATYDYAVQHGKQAILINLEERHGNAS